METKTFFKISYYSTLLGWFPYMFIAAIGSHWNSESKLIIAGIGLGLCLFGAMMSHSFLQTSKGIFNSLDELEEEKQKYREATAKYNKAEEELKNKLLNNQI